MNWKKRFMQMGAMGQVLCGDLEKLPGDVEP